MKRQKTRRFVVGFKGRGQTTVSGRRQFLDASHTDYRLDDFCELMTQREARKALKTMGAGATVYEVMPVCLRLGD